MSYPIITVTTTFQHRFIPENITIQSWQKQCWGRKMSMAWTMMLVVLPITTPMKMASKNLLIGSMVVPKLIICGTDSYNQKWVWGEKYVTDLQHMVATRYRCSRLKVFINVISKFLIKFLFWPKPASLAKPCHGSCQGGTQLIWCDPIYELIELVCLCILLIRY